MSDIGFIAGLNGGASRADTDSFGNAQNVGGGFEVFRDKTTLLNFRTLTAGSNIAIVQNADTLDIACTLTATTPGGPENAIQFNTAGAFDGSANLTWDDNQLKITGTADANQFKILTSGSQSNPIIDISDSTDVTQYFGVAADGSVMMEDEKVIRITDTQTGATDNVLIGQGLTTGLTSGTKNTAIGHNCMTSMTTGTSNVALGSGAMRDMETGTGNFALGTDALKLNVSGSNNLAIGSNALNRCTVTGNVALGGDCLRFLTSGSSTVGIGTNAGYLRTLGFGNVLIGERAGYSGTTGSRNVFIGRRAGQGNTGSDNVMLGYFVGSTNFAGSSNVLAIHNADTATPLIHGDMGSGSESLTINGEFESTDSVNHSAVETVTASSDTLDRTNHTVECDCSSNAITINLPAASGNTGLEYEIGKVDSTGNIVTIDPNGSETITTPTGAATTITITVQATFVKLRCNGTNWVMISQG